MILRDIQIREYINLRAASRGTNRDDREDEFLHYLHKTTNNYW